MRLKCVRNGMHVGAAHIIIIILKERKTNECRDSLENHFGPLVGKNVVSRVSFVRDPAEIRFKHAHPQTARESERRARNKFEIFDTKMKLSFEHFVARAEREPNRGRQKEKREKCAREYGRNQVDRDRF